MDTVSPDRIFRYNYSGTLLGSLNLGTGNTAPEGIADINGEAWVVDNASTDRIFRYNYSGTLLGQSQPWHRQHHPAKA